MKQKLLLKTCFKCRTDKTQINQGKYEAWHHDKEGNMICSKCYYKEWYVNNRDHKLAYMKEWLSDNLEYRKAYYKLWCSNNRELIKFHNILHQPRNNQLRRIHTAVKRGWGWTS